MIKPCLGPSSCLTTLPSITVLQPPGFAQFLTHHMLCCMAFALVPSPHPHLKAFFLHTLVILISSHPLDLSGNMSCSKTTSLTAPPLLVTPFHITLLHILPSTSQYLELLYLYIYLLSVFSNMFHGTENMLPGSLFCSQEQNATCHLGSLQSVFVR